MTNWKATRTLAIAAGVLVISGAWAQQQIHVMVNGKQVQFQNSGPRQERGRVLVPLRGVLEELGAYVGWDQSTRMVTASRGDLNIKMTVGSTMADVNGRAVAMDVPAEIVDGSTLVPLRFMSEILGAKVQWIEANQTVQIDTMITEAAVTTPSVTSIVTPTPAALMINSFTADHTGFFPAGTSVHFTLMGTPVLHFLSPSDP